MSNTQVAIDALNQLYKQDEVIAELKQQITELEMNVLDKNAALLHLTTELHNTRQQLTALLDKGEPVAWKIKDPTHEEGYRIVKPLFGLGD